MNTLHFKGIECHTSGILPVVGKRAPSFLLTDTTLNKINDKQYRGKRIVLNIFPSLDTDVCAMSVRRFNAEAAGLENTQVICVSMDLPFAAQRFCSTNGIDNLIVTSAFRSPTFGRRYGVALSDGPLRGLLARAVVVIDEAFHVLHVELVDEITKEPDYAAAIKALNTKA